MRRKPVQGFDKEVTGVAFVGDTDQVIASPYIANLRKIGVDATLRIIDQTQYINRNNNFDFDVVTGLFGQSDSAGNEQRDF